MSAQAPRNGRLDLIKHTRQCTQHLLLARLSTYSRMIQLVCLLLLQSLSSRTILLNSVWDSTAAAVSRLSLSRLIHGVLTFRRPDFSPSHPQLDRPVLPMQLIVESTSVAKNLVIRVAAPHWCRGGLTFEAFEVAPIAVVRKVGLLGRGHWPGRIMHLVIEPASVAQKLALGASAPGWGIRSPTVATFGWTLALSTLREGAQARSFQPFGTSCKHRVRSGILGGKGFGRIRRHIKRT